MPIYRICPKCKKNILVGSKHSCISKKRVRNQRVYDTKKWHRLRDYVRANYYVCARCGSIDDLQLHHIYKIDTHIEKAYDIDNVCLLCPACHKYVDTNCKSGTLDFKFERYEYKYNLL